VPVIRGQHGLGFVGPHEPSHLRSTMRRLVHLRTDQRLGGGCSGAQTDPASGETVQQSPASAATSMGTTVPSRGSMGWRSKWGYDAIDVTRGDSNDNAPFLGPHPRDPERKVLGCQLSF
jgi:hypothetical protein